MAKQHIIELNGNRYDAVTGKMIANTPSPKTPQAASKIKKGTDGFGVSRKRPVQHNVSPGHKTEKSKTLMRGIIQKPKPQHNKAVASPAKGDQHIQSSKLVSAGKLAHAIQIPRSSLIRRFGDNSIIPSASRAKSATKPPLKVTPVHAVASAVTDSTDPIAIGMANANSHEETKAKRARRHVRLARRLRISPKVLSGGSLVLASLLIAGFFGYQNVPNLNMRIASARSGVHGSLPEFQPAGFALDGGISYKPGQIVIGYKSKTDDRNFKITQSSSSWNSETLVSNFFGGSNCGARCQVVEDRGKTIYLYEGSNATWVDGGIWYRVEGKSQLNSDQLLNIAASL